EIDGVAGALRGFAVDRQPQPAPDPARALLALDHPHGDRDHEGAQRRRFAQARQLAKQPDEDLLDRVIDLAAGTAGAEHQASYQGIVAIPQRRLRPRLAAQTGAHQILVARAVEADLDAAPQSQAYPAVAHLV